MLDLPNVTLIAVETRTHELMRRTLADAVSKINFGGVAIFSDQPQLIPIPNAQYHTVPNWSNKEQQGCFYYQEAAQAAKTSHALMIEWDGGIRDVGMWRDEFLTYDCIGAPWNWVKPNDFPQFSVGNGGFMLISKRLADAVYAQRERLRISTDVHLCRRNRMFFEQSIGAKWAPEYIGFQFSFEHPRSGSTRRLAAPSFGYHDVFNWPLALSPDEVTRRARLIQENTYAKRTSKLNTLCREWPEVAQSLSYTPPSPDRPRLPHHRPPVPIQSQPPKRFPPRLRNAGIKA